MTIYYREPMFALPLIFASSVMVRVVLDTPSVTVTATIPAGTYYWTGDVAQPDDLAGLIASGLTTAETSAGTDGVWTASYGEGGLGDKGIQPRLTRVAGDGADVVTSLMFPSSSTFPGNSMGFAGNTVAAPAHAPGADVALQALSARYVWCPMMPPRVGHSTPKRSGGVAVSGAGKSALLTQAPVRMKALSFENVRGCLVTLDLLSRGYGAIAGLVPEDVNAPLEVFWADHGTIAPIRYYPGKSDADVFEAWEINDASWLFDPFGAGSFEVGEESLDYWRIEMPLAPYVA